MSIFNNNILAGAASQSTTTPVHTIDQSIRFNSADDGNMYRVVGSGGNTKTWTFSGWFKLGLLGSQRGASPFLWSGYQDDSNRLQLMLDNAVGTGAAGDFLCLYSSTSGSIFQTTRVFRDPSAWYHIVVVSDTSNAVSSERIRLYINGIRETSFSTINYPSLNADLAWNKDGSTWYLGKYYSGSGSGTYNYDGYMAELVNLDGTATDCNSFGEFNSNGIWVPKDVSGLSFGTKGWYIDGRDSSDLGDDESGNGNDFTTSGLAAHDQVADSPTNNFAVTNAVNSHPNVALSECNLKQVNSGTSIAYGSSSTILLTSGKWYVEWRLNTLVSNEYPVVGLYSTNEGRSSLSTASSFPGLLGTFADIGFGANDGNRFEDNTTTSSWGNAYANGNIAALAIDMDNKKIWFGHNNSGSFVWQASGDPAAGSNEANTKAFASDVVVGVGHYSSSSVTFNYGQDGTFGGTETAQGNADGNGVGNFYYAPPTGFLAICTKNLGS